jgi:hypothetical protein
VSDWREPITDRTLADVEGFDSSSLEYQKGTLNADDLNRIEGNFAYLEEKLRSDAIFIPRIFRNYEETTLNADGTETRTTYTDWQENNLPWMSEINRIRANYNALVRLFLSGLGLPVLYNRNYLDFTEVNDWERIADKGKTMFENMENEYKRCGAFVCCGDGVDWVPYEYISGTVAKLGIGVLGKMIIGKEE